MTETNSATQNIDTAGSHRAPRISATNDLSERRADEIADRGLFGSGAVVGQTAAAGGEPYASPFDARPLSAEARPLPYGERRDFERRYRTDFADVRIHTGPEADRAAGRLNARAFAHGRNIGFARGAYHPDDPAGRHLLAHELAHFAHDPRPGPVLHRFAACRHLLDAAEERGATVSESAVRDYVLADARSLGTAERELPIPAGSAAPRRTEGRRGDDTVIDPQVIGPAGVGYADITVLTGTRLDLIEVKKATWGPAEGPRAGDGVTFAAGQVDNYVLQANANLPELNRTWQQTRGNAGERITRVRAMPTSRITPVTPARISGQIVSLAWCRSGVMSYKQIGDRDPDVFTCVGSDQGRIDQMLDRLTEPAQAKMERFISRNVERPVNNAIRDMPLDEMIEMVLNHPSVQSITGFSDPTLIEVLADLAAEQLESLAALIRGVARSFIHQVLSELRQRMQDMLRSMLQDAIIAACAGAAAFTLNELWEHLRRLMEQAAASLLPEIAIAVARRIIEQAIIDALTGLAIAIGVAVAAFLLWEAVAAAAAIEGIGALLATIGTAIMNGLRYLLPPVLAFG